MASFTRGFLGRNHGERDPRLPPGQYDAGDDWPVLTAEVTPDLPTDTWTFTVDGLVEHPTTWTWDEIHALPPSTYDGAIHCVTTWSKFDMTFAGVSVDTLLAAAGPLPTATHVLAFSHTGYTTNLPLADVTGGKAWVAWEVDGEPAAGRARRTGPAARAAPLLLEERQVGVGPARCSTTTSRASGSATATTTAATPGSSSATRATDGRRSTATPRADPGGTGRGRRPVVAITRRDGPGQDVPPGARPAGARTSPASTSSSASPRRTATGPCGRTRWRRRPTTPARSS